MPLNRSQTHLALAVVTLLVAGLVLVRLSGFGIWDPWELEAADLARRLADGETVERVSLSVRLAGWGFGAFGVQEWAGRLPIALAGVLLIPLVYGLLARHGQPRAGLYAALVAGSCPLFLFNARPMLGEAPLFVVHTLVGLAVAELLLARPGGNQALLLRSLWLLATTGLAAVTAGVLLGALPPLLAGAALALILREPEAGPERRLASAVLVGTALVAGLFVVRAVLLDAAGHSLWTGGHPMAIVPPTFDRFLERIFHAFAPWSALLPLALAALTLTPIGEVATPVPGGSSRDERGLRLFVLLWAGAAVAAHSVFVSRYAEITSFIALTPLAAAVGFYLADVEEDGRSRWPAAVACLFLVGLILRDYALYPDGPAQGMPVKDITIPEVFNPKRIWAGLLGGFGLCVVLALGLGETRVRAQPSAPYQLLRRQWQRGLPFRLWLCAFGLLALGTLALGAMGWVAPERAKLSTLGAKVARGAALVPLALPIGVFVLQWLLDGWTRVRRLRMPLLAVSGLAFAGYASQGYLPALSGHFSPREVYESFNRLAEPGAALAEYQVGGRAAKYYARGEVIELAQLSELVDHLSGEGPRWAAFAREELASVDRQFRQRKGRHLFVADARSARVVLATNHDVKGVKDQNPIAPFLLSKPPAIQNPVHADLDGKLEFLGYDLDLPHATHVGAGESFGVTWYFRVKQRVAGNYKVFVHIDGDGQRIHGDHEPVNEQYPVRLWEPGDVIADTQRLDVPGNFRAGSYSVFLGLYSGDARMPILEGPKDADNRIRAGVLHIR